MFNYIHYDINDQYKSKNKREILKTSFNGQNIVLLSFKKDIQEIGSSIDGTAYYIDDSISTFEYGVSKYPISINVIYKHSTDSIFILESEYTSINIGAFSLGYKNSKPISIKSYSKIMEYNTTTQLTRSSYVNSVREKDYINIENNTFPFDISYSTGLIKNPEEIGFCEWPEFTEIKDISEITDDRCNGYSTIKNNKQVKNFVNLYSKINPNNRWAYIVFVLCKWVSISCSENV